MQIDDLEWDDRNEAHIARHQVEPEEVEDVCYGNHIVRRSRGGRYEVCGQTDGGRYLVVVLEPLGGNRYRPVTARDMGVREQRSYRRMRR